MEKSDLYAMEETARMIGRNIGKALEGSGVGFCLGLFTLGDGGFTTYISNCNREDMLKAMRELLDKIEEQPGATFIRKETQ